MRRHGSRLRNLRRRAAGLSSSSSGNGGGVGWGGGEGRLLAFMKDRAGGLLPIAPRAACGAAATPSWDVVRKAFRAVLWAGAAGLGGYASAVYIFRDDLCFNALQKVSSRSTSSSSSSSVSSPDDSPPPGSPEDVRCFRRALSLPPAGLMVVLSGPEPGDAAGFLSKSLSGRPATVMVRLGPTITPRGMARALAQAADLRYLELADMLAGLLGLDGGSSSKEESVAAALDTITAALEEIRRGGARRHLAPVIVVEGALRHLGNDATSTAGGPPSEVLDKFLRWCWQISERRLAHVVLTGPNSFALNGGQEALTGAAGAGWGALSLWMPESASREEVEQALRRRLQKLQVPRDDQEEQVALMMDVLWQPHGLGPLAAFHQLQGGDSPALASLRQLLMDSWARVGAAVEGLAGGGATGSARTADALARCLSPLFNDLSGDRGKEYEECGCDGRVCAFRGSPAMARALDLMRALATAASEGRGGLSLGAGIELLGGDRAALSALLSSGVVCLASSGRTGQLAAVDELQLVPRSPLVSHAFAILTNSSCRGSGESSLGLVLRSEALLVSEAESLRRRAKAMKRREERVSQLRLDVVREQRIHASRRSLRSPKLGQRMTAQLESLEQELTCEEEELTHRKVALRATAEVLEERLREHARLCGGEMRAAAASLLLCAVRSMSAAASAASDLEDAQAQLQRKNMVADALLGAAQLEGPEGVLSAPAIRGALAGFGLFLTTDQVRQCLEGGREEEDDDEMGLLSIVDALISKELSLCKKKGEPAGAREPPPAAPSRPPEEQQEPPEEQQGTDN
jgi:hypothetical protein